MKQVYCRYCGKQIDEDASFCTHCGEKQSIQNIRLILNRMVNSMNCSWKQSYDAILTKFRSIKFPIPNSVSFVNFKKWAKRIFLLIVILISLGLLILLSMWLYGLYKTSEWTKEDKQREDIALQNITKADSIARVLFQEFADYKHRYDLLDFPTCDFNHVEKGIQILRNAAEKGDANAQFTLGCIYAGARYDSNYRKWDDTYTMLNESIDHERAAYWYNQAANQGVTSAMGNLANYYRYGRGVEMNLIKATELMKSAAEKGNAHAQLNLGDMYRDGEVFIKVELDSVDGGSYVIRVKPNVEMAKEWWKKALENGNESAKERLEKIYD